MSDKWKCEEETQMGISGSKTVSTKQAHIAKLAKQSANRSESGYFQILRYAGQGAKLFGLRIRDGVVTR